MFLFAVALALGVSSQTAGPSQMMLGKVADGHYVILSGPSEEDTTLAELHALVTANAPTESFVCMEMEAQVRSCSIYLNQTSDLVSMSHQASGGGAWSVVFGGAAAQQLREMLKASEQTTGMPNFLASPSRRLFCDLESVCVVTSEPIQIGG